MTFHRSRLLGTTLGHSIKVLPEGARAARSGRYPAFDKQDVQPGSQQQIRTILCINV